MSLAKLANLVNGKELDNTLGYPYMQDMHMGRKVYWRFSLDRNYSQSRSFFREPSGEVGSHAVITTQHPCATQSKTYNRMANTTW